MTEVKLTEAATEQFIKALEETETGLNHVRIVCTGVSCSGPQFQMGFDEKQENDYEIALSEATSVVVGPETLEILNGTTIDFETNKLGVSGFRFLNENHGAGCSSCPAKGCGSRSDDE